MTDEAVFVALPQRAPKQKRKRQHTQYEEHNADISKEQAAVMEAAEAPAKPDIENQYDATEETNVKISTGNTTIQNKKDGKYRHAAVRGHKFECTY